MRASNVRGALAVIQPCFEGVSYYRYRVRYVTADNTRRTKVLWAPGDPWIRETVDYWIYRADIQVKPGSNVRVSRFPHPCEESS